MNNVSKFYILIGELEDSNNESEDQPSDHWLLGEACLNTVSTSVCTAAAVVASASAAAAGCCGSACGPSCTAGGSAAAGASGVAGSVDGTAAELAREAVLEDKPSWLPSRMAEAAVAECCEAPGEVPPCSAFSASSALSAPVMCSVGPWGFHQ